MPTTLRGSRKLAAAAQGDCEPLPKDADVLDAWRHYHAGAFADAVAAGAARASTPRSKPR
jgi:hypothetical protein